MTKDQKNHTWDHVRDEAGCPFCHPKDQKVSTEGWEEFNNKLDIVFRNIGSFGVDTQKDAIRFNVTSLLLQKEREVLEMVKNQIREEWHHIDEDDTEYGVYCKRHVDYINNKLKELND